MGAIFEVDIPVLLSPELPISINAARSVVRRWEKAGVVQAEAMLARQGRLVRLTATGMLLMTEHGGGADVRAQTSALAVHWALASRVRLRIEEAALGAGPMRGWVSERQWRLDNADAVSSGDYVPHGMVLLADGSVGAVHIAHTAVELNWLQSQLAEISRNHPRIVIAVPPDLGGREPALVLADTAAKMAVHLQFVDL